MRIVIVDDDPIVVDSLASIAELQSDGEIRVTGKGKDGQEAIDLYIKEKPDIILLDIQMKPLSGLDALEEILKIDDEAKALFLTTFLLDEYIVKAMKIGARGYLLKTDVKRLVPSLKAIYGGGYVYGDQIIEKIPELLKDSYQGDFFKNLTEREWEIVKLVADGKNNREIGEELFLSQGTVRNYLSVILEKLDLRDRTQLAIAYYKNR